MLRGEHVIYYCTEEFREKIEQTGAEFRPYKGRINKFEISNDDMFRALVLINAMTVDKLEHNLDEIRDERPDYIVHDSLCTWGKHIASIAGVPAVNLMHSYPLTRSSFGLRLETLSLILKVGLHKVASRFNPGSAANSLKKKYNINLSHSDALINFEDLNIIYTSKYMAPKIDESEDSYHFVGPSLFFRDDKSDFPFEKLKGKQVVYISLGTLHCNNPAFYRMCIDAFLGKDCTVIISVGMEVDLQQLPGAPDNFIIRKSVPQQKLLEHTSLFITHAGMNSVNEAICAGVPMLLLPHQFEQKMIARKIEELGIGIHMAIGDLDEKSLVASSEKITSGSSFKQRALELSELFLEEERTSHIRAADEILQFVDNVIGKRKERS